MTALVTWLLEQISADEKVTDLRYNEPCPTCRTPMGAMSTAWGIGFDMTVIVEPCGHTFQGADQDSLWKQVPASPRVLAECDSKRAIIYFCRPVPGRPEGEGAFVADHVLKLLALLYADRPGYLEEWRP